jgi:hypothetical protein
MFCMIRKLIYKRNDLFCSYLWTIFSASTCRTCFLCSRRANLERYSLSDIISPRRLT